jgi:hypothetical protein
METESVPRIALEQNDFEGFYRAHVARHRSAANRWVVFIFDHVLLGSLLLALRRPKAGLSLYVVAFGVLVLGHAALERNLGRELEALLKDPLTSLRAERRFLAAMWRKGPSAFDPALD